MRDIRNPFRLRASENIESDDAFVRLFSPEVLAVLGTESLWENPIIIRSAPGGGKTSLLRLFTPESLHKIYTLRLGDDLKELFYRLKDIGAIDEQGPLVLGALISLSSNYAELEDLKIESTKRTRIFRALLNARITLSILKGAAALKRISYPDDLLKITISCKEPATLSPELSFPCTGRQLYEWAKSLEESICDALDSFAPMRSISIPGDDLITILQLFKHGTMEYNGKVVATKVIVMLDDAHKISKNQRERLFNEVLTSRPNIGVWIAERLEALDTADLLAPGSLLGRDYEKIIVLEDYWRRWGGKRFRPVAENVANRRAKDAKIVEMGSFTECLQDSLEGTEWRERFLESIKVISSRLKNNSTLYHRYGEWISNGEEFKGTARERAINWRNIEILIQREENKKQISLDFPAGIDEFEKRQESSSVMAAARLFLSGEFKIPYYYSILQLVSMSSANIEQFLWLAGDIFEEAVSAALLRRSTALAPDKQERILKDAAKRRWESFPRTVKHGNEVRRFLESIGKFAQQITNLPNAPYAPGVTGIAISMADREKLIDPSSTEQNESYSLLGKVIGSCIAHNLLEVRLHQKAKGKEWMVLYLNRMHCLYFNLPLNYGGWREQTMQELVNWLQRGYSRASRKNDNDAS